MATAEAAAAARNRRRGRLATLHEQEPEPEPEPLSYLCMVSSVPSPALWAPWHGEPEGQPRPTTLQAAQRRLALGLGLLSGLADYLVDDVISAVGARVAGEVTPPAPPPPPCLQLSLVSPRWCRRTGSEGCCAAWTWRTKPRRSSAI